MDNSNNNKDNLSKVSDALSIAESVHGLISAIASKDVAGGLLHTAKLGLAAYIALRTYWLKPKIGNDNHDDHDDGAPRA